MKYLGFFDGHPANIHRHPPVAAGRRYVAFMGGADAVVEKSREAFEEGDYRWVAEVLNHVVMSEPGHEEARWLLADALEQLGYQAESAVWRNFYLSGARELRDPVTTGSVYAPSADTVRQMPLGDFFKAMAVRLDGERAAAVTVDINLAFTDTGPWLLSISNGVLHARPDRYSEGAATTVRVSAEDFKLLMTDHAGVDQLLETERLVIEGDRTGLQLLNDLLDHFPRRFPIVAPRDGS